MAADGDVALYGMSGQRAAGAGLYADGASKLSVRKVLAHSTKKK
jgi:hypothetical protein